MPERATLLVELLTEELPPKSLKRLSEAFTDSVFNGLVKSQLRQGALEGRRILATPRRLAVAIAEVSPSGQDREIEVTGPSTSAPLQAVEGFARKHGLKANELERRSGPKGEVFLARTNVPGAVLDKILPGLIEESLKALPVPKLMRWGSGDVQFVRPVHGIVVLHGERIVPGSVLGLASGRSTLGHRFLGSGPIHLKSADDYEAQLRAEGMVIADYQTRREEIERQLKEAAAAEKAGLGDYADLLDEVTALVEYPQVHVGAFDAAFLAVPQECLMLTMRQNQKYFPLLGADGRLRNRFLIVSNMSVPDARPIVTGNERVVRPRLEDARFFYNQDRKQRLEARVPQLANVVYHAKLGSQLERTERVQLLAGAIARELKADAVLTERAAWLAKADLLTGMVGEFPELQGIMGRYYALHDGEPQPVADAIEAHYRPRFAGDRLPQSAMECAVAVADKLDSLAGLFGIRQMPTGDKDPFGLRRAALGVVRILIERKLPLRLPDLVGAAFDRFKGKAGVERAMGDVEAFVAERLRSYLREIGYSVNEIEAVLALNPARLDLISKQLEAVRAFSALPEAESLAAANKRVVNILKQAAAKGESFNKADAAVLKEPAERALFEALAQSSERAARLFESGDYTAYLKTFAVLKSPVDKFFDAVMVMVDEPNVRRNRLALLHDLQQSMNRIADLSKLAK